MRLVRGQRGRFVLGEHDDEDDGPDAGLLAPAGADAGDRVAGQVALLEEDPPPARVVLRQDRPADVLHGGVGDSGDVSRGESLQDGSQRGSGRLVVSVRLPIRQHVAANGDRGESGVAIPDRAGRPRRTAQEGDGDVGGGVVDEIRGGDRAHHDPAEATDGDRRQATADLVALPGVEVGDRRVVILQDGVQTRRRLIQGIREPGEQLDEDRRLDGAGGGERLARTARIQGVPRRSADPEPGADSPALLREDRPHRLVGLVAIHLGNVIGGEEPRGDDPGHGDREGNDGVALTDARGDRADLGRRLHAQVTPW